MWLSKFLMSNKATLCEANAALLSARNASNKDQAWKLYNEAHYYYKGNPQTNPDLMREAFVMKYLLQGAHALLARDYYRAAEYFRIVYTQILTTDSYSSTAFAISITRDYALLLYASSLRQNGNMVEARNYFENFLQRHPNNVLALEESGDVHAFFKTSEESLLTALDEYSRARMLLLPDKTEDIQVILVKILNLYSYIFELVESPEYLLEDYLDNYKDLENLMGKEAFKSTFGRAYAQSLLYAQKYEVAVLYSGSKSLHHLSRIAQNKFTEADLDVVKKIMPHLDTNDCTYLTHLANALLNSRNRDLLNYAYEIKNSLAEVKLHLENSNGLRKQIDRLFQWDSGFKSTLFAQSKVISLFAKEMIEVRTMANR